MTEGSEWGWDKNLLLSTISVPIVIAELFVQVEVFCKWISTYSLYHWKWGQNRKCEPIRSLLPLVLRAEAKFVSAVDPLL